MMPGRNTARRTNRRYATVSSFMPMTRAIAKPAASCASCQPESRQNWAIPASWQPRRKGTDHAVSSRCILLRSSASIQNRHPHSSRRLTDLGSELRDMGGSALSKSAAPVCRTTCAPRSRRNGLSGDHHHSLIPMLLVVPDGCTPTCPVPPRIIAAKLWLHK